MPKSAGKKAYEKKLAYNNEYNRQNYRSFSVRFNRDEETKIIKWLEKQENIKKYLKDLISKDIEDHSSEIEEI